ncbi:MAG TPA: hypothetical protein PK863_01740 [Candidatus Dojkabacteria bacterium]|nr:hypothetical protein [Candidatus Dojkabacteria bacterium]HRP50817.1 hypothetical protein [Candidatus Dojkabacteria bacterium]
MTDGLILDIDDTLAETALTAISIMREKFNHPDSVWELLTKYEQPGNVPEWQSIEAQEFLLKTMQSEEFLLNLPRVPDSLEVIEKLSIDFPVQFYMTSRFTKLENLTKDWLNKNNFPTKNIIFVEHTNSDDAWKFKYLIERGDENRIFIDNHLPSFGTNVETYKGKLIWLNRYNEQTGLKVVSLNSWQSIYDYLRQ